MKRKEQIGQESKKLSGRPKDLGRRDKNPGGEKRTDQENLSDLKKPQKKNRKKLLRLYRREK